MVELQQICLDKRWCRLLADRWHVSLMTIRRWTAYGLLGEVHRRNIACVRLSSMAVWEFEKRYADVLSVGEPVFNLNQVAKRYGVHRRTVHGWRERNMFPSPDRVPTSYMIRWRLSQLERWEAHFGIIPVSKFHDSP